MCVSYIILFSIVFSENSTWTDLGVFVSHLNELILSGELELKVEGAMFSVQRVAHIVKQSDAKCLPGTVHEGEVCCKCALSVL